MIDDGGGGGRSGVSGVEVDLEDGDFGGGDAVDARGLSEGCGASFLEFGAGLGGESLEVIGEVGGDGAGFEAVHLVDLELLVSDVAGVAGVDEELFEDSWGELWETGVLVVAEVGVGEEFEDAVSVESDVGEGLSCLAEVPREGLDLLEALCGGESGLVSESCEASVSVVLPEREPEFGA